MLQSVWRPAFRPVMGSVWDAAKGRGGSPEPSLSELVREHFGSSLAGMYDFVNLQGLYQDASGTMPVTAYDQPIGLALDGSRGYERGEELILDPDFDNAALWQSGAGWSVSSGTATAASAENGAVVQVLFADRPQMTPGETFEVEAVVSAISQGGLAVVISGATSPALSVGVNRIVLTATTSAGNIGVRALGVSSGVVESLSVRRLPGNHLTQSTTASRPTYTAQGARHDGVDDSLRAALADDWTFLHDGSGGTLGISGSYDDTTEGGHQSTGTQGGSTSSVGVRVGLQNVPLERLYFVANQGDGPATLTSVTGSFPPNTVRSGIVSTGGAVVRAWDDASLIGEEAVSSAATSAPQNPLRTITGANNAGVAYRRRIIAIREAVTDPTDIALLDAWLREGA